MTTLGDGGLALTLRFENVERLDSFADIARAVNWADLTAEDSDRWTAFCRALDALTDAAPDPERGLRVLPDHPLKIDGQPVDYETQASYHAQIDAQRIPPRDTL